MVRSVAVRCLPPHGALCGGTLLTNPGNSAHGWNGTRLGFWANGIVGWEEVWGCWWRCVGQLDAFWAFKHSQGGEILGKATKPQGLAYARIFFGLTPYFDPQILIADPLF